MKMVNYKKVIAVASLGTVMALGSMSSAFAADLHTVAPTKKVEQNQKQQQHNNKPQQQHPQLPQHHVTLLTETQATDIALTQYQGLVKDIQLTIEYGKNVYIIVIHSNDGIDHTVTVDAVTGSIL
jgi:uncharacterized membrane protein YkoI